MLGDRVMGKVRVWLELLAPPIKSRERERAGREAPTVGSTVSSLS